MKYLDFDEIEKHFEKLGNKRCRRVFYEKISNKSISHKECIALSLLYHEHSKSDVDELFYKTFDSNFNFKLLNEYFFVEIPCYSCASFFYRRFDRYMFLAYLKSFDNSGCCDGIMCEKCVKKYVEERKIEAKSTDTGIFCDEYLGTMESFESLHGYSSEEVSYDDLWEWINVDDEKVFLEKVKETVKKLKYKEFLKTPYWKAISYKVKKVAGGKCQLCNSEKKLVTHHKTYENHGLEHLHMDDLIVLCSKCHSKFHDKIKQHVEEKK